MVSFQHEVMHHVFRRDPGVFARACRELHLPFGDPKNVELLPNELSELDVARTKPLFRYPDTVLRFTAIP